MAESLRTLVDWFVSLFFKTESLYVALAALELDVQTRLAPNSQNFLLLRAGTKDTCYQVWALPFLDGNFFFAGKSFSSTLRE